jgi:hypothetical protein
MNLQNKTAIVTGAAAGMENVLRSTIQKIQKFGCVAMAGGLSI